MIPLTEEELIFKIRSNDKQAFGYLYEAYAPALLGRIQRLVNCPQAARDVLQVVFIKIWSHSDKYDADKGRLLTWMFNIARNTSIDHLRSQQVHPVHCSTDEVYSLNEKADLFKNVQSRLDIRKLLCHLSKKDSVILELVLTGFTCKEIGKLLCLPEGTIKTRMRASYKRLRLILLSDRPAPVLA
jgi:RNA polymerase sigma-70 factor (ECF subfamily)